MFKLEVAYNNKKIQNNIFLSPEQTIIQPQIFLNSNSNSNPNPNALYTLIMYDPDAINGTYIHWLITNVKNNDITKGNILIPYKGPAPPPKTGKHRYIFKLYEQSGEITNQPITFERSISINDLINKLNFINSNSVAEIKFISENISGGKTKKIKRRKTKRIKRRNNRKTRKSSRN